MKMLFALCEKATACFARLRRIITTLDSGLSNKRHVIQLQLACGVPVEFYDVCSRVTGRLVNYILEYI